MPTLYISLLGGFRLIYDSTPIATVQSPRLKSLFTYLVLHRSMPQSRHHLAFLFWPDSIESQARANLRKSLRELVHSLPDAERFILMDGATVQWREEAPFVLDAAEFEMAATSAKSTVDLQRAVGLYRGDLLPECYDDWIVTERDRLAQLHVAILERLIGRLEDERDYSAAIRYSLHLVRLEPLQESAYRRLMRLYALSDDRAGALRTYRDCAAVLQRELGVEPSPATREAYTRLLQVEALLPPSGHALPRLVGRQREWARLLTGWHLAAAGGAYCILVSGEAGIGKTRLAEELLHWAARQGIRTAAARCYAAEGTLSYAPITAWFRALPQPRLDPVWLAEIARLLPEVSIAHPELPISAGPGEAWERHRLFEALARAALARQPLILLLDDLQWCDADTLTWLHYLMRFDAQARLLLVATMRSEDARPDPLFGNLLAALRQNGRLDEIELSPLGEDDTALLAAQATGHRLEAGLAARLFQDTEGNPLFILEMVRSGLPDASRFSRVPLPRTIQAVLQSRLAQLSPAARELSGLLAAHGRAFSFEVLFQAAGGEEEATAQALDELYRRRIVRTGGEHTIDFGHGMFRDVVYAGLTPAQRLLLHRRLAQALERVYANDLDAVVGQIATHFERGGLPDRAVPYLIRAGDTARRVYANEAAIDAYRRALSLLPEAAGIEIRLKLGEVLHLVGRWTEAEDLLRRTLDLVRRGDPGMRARCMVALAEVLHWRGSYAEALTCLEQARVTFEALGDEVGLSRVLENMGLVYNWQGDYRRAVASHEQQLQIATETDDLQGICRAIGFLGLDYWQQGDHERALACFRDEYERAERLGDRVSMDRALGRTGLVYWEQGDPARALACFEQQQAIASEVGDRLGLSYALGNIGILHEERGNFGLALTWYSRQLDIVSELGDRRSIANLLGNMGFAYYEQGEHDRARTCHVSALQIAVELGERRIVANAVENLAVTCAAQGRFIEAKRMFKLALALLPILNVPYHWCETLYFAAELYAGLEQYAEAQELNHQALQIATKRNVHRIVQFKASILAVRLRVALGQLEPAAAVAELEGLALVWPDDEQQAAIQYELWRLDPSNETRGQRCAGLYRQLYAHTPRFEYRRRVLELTGERLADPPPLPDLPELVTQDTADLESLLTRVGDIVTGGSSIELPDG